MSNGCHTPRMSNEQPCSAFISPMSTLSANLGTNLHIRRNLPFGNSGDNAAVKLTEADRNVAVFPPSPNRVLKHAKFSPGIGGGCANNGGGRIRQIFAKRPNGNAVNGSKTPIDKENSSSRRSFSYMMECSLDSDDECSPSKFTVARCVSRERYPLEDQDPNSQDSGFSSSCYPCSDDSKSSSNFRFAEPNGVAPRRSMTAEFSPGCELSSPSSRKSTTSSPRYRKELSHRVSSTDSMSSDFSDDGFAENVAMLPSAGSVLMEQDENARLPPGFSALLSEPIFNVGKAKETSKVASSCETSVLQTSFRRSLTENLVTTNRTVVRSFVETEFSDFLLEKDALKRTAEDDETRPFLKRRKSYNKVIKSDADGTWTSSGPVTAPPAPSSRVTLFDYGFSVKTNVKFQRSFSETEATIKRAVQRAASNSNLIGDFSKPCVLPLVLGDPDTADLKNIDCHTLAKLMNGDYNDDVSSFTIIDCRYPFEYEGGHIKGAVNIYSRPQMTKALGEKKLSSRSGDGENSAGSEDRKRNILIFHCEYSSKRGPSLSRYLRNEDRQKNGIHYPKLDYPEIYLLKEGYKTFFAQYEHLCEPRGYITMNDPNHSESLRKLKIQSKSTGCIGESRKLRTSSYKRLGL